MRSGCCFAEPNPADNDELHRKKLMELSGMKPGQMRVGRMADPQIDHVLLSESQIARKVTELSGRMSADYKALGAKRVTLICVLKGSFMFTADLARALSHAGVDCEIEFISVSSYGDRSSSSGTVRMEMDTRHDVAGKHVLIVEDIVDSGNTMLRLHEMFKLREPASLKTVVLLAKTERHSAAFKERQTLSSIVNYIGFEIPDKFVGGYGLDFAERYRELADICVLSIK